MPSLKDILAIKRAKGTTSNGVSSNLSETNTPPDNSNPVHDSIPLEEIAPREIPPEHIKILQKISDLSTIESIDSLKSEMDNLKKALKENPTAVDIMLPEDIGAMVAALYKITGRAIQDANAPKERKPRESKKNTALTIEEINAAFTEI